jgi:hypothetical protein
MNLVRLNRILLQSLIQECVFATKDFLDCLAKTHAVLLLRVQHFAVDLRVERVLLLQLALARITESATIKQELACVAKDFSAPTAPRRTVRSATEKSAPATASATARADAASASPTMNSQPACGTAQAARSATPTSPAANPTDAKPAAPFPRTSSPWTAPSRCAAGAARASSRETAPAISTRPRPSAAALAKTRRRFALPAPAERTERTASSPARARTAACAIKAETERDAAPTASSDSSVSSARFRASDRFLEFLFAQVTDSARPLTELAPAS